jgi:hypothetical protein
MPTYEDANGRRITVGWDASDDELDVLFSSGGPVTGPSKFTSGTIPGFNNKIVKAPSPNIKTQDFNAGPKSTARKAWDWANSPLVTAPSRWGRSASNWMTEPELDDSKYTAMAKGFIGGALEGTGDVISGLTTPLSVASLGSRGIASTGLRGYKTAANALDKFGGAGMMLEGGGEVLDPSASWGERGLGLAKMAGGATAFTPAPKPKFEILPPETPIPGPGARTLGGAVDQKYLPLPRTVEPPVWYQGRAGVVKEGNYPVDVGTTSPLIQGRRTTPAIKEGTKTWSGEPVWMQNAQNMKPSEIASTADTLRAGEIVDMPAPYVAEHGQRLGAPDVKTVAAPDFASKVRSDPRLPAHYRDPEIERMVDQIEATTTPKPYDRERPSPELLAPITPPVRKPRGEPTPGSGVYSKQNIAFDRYRVRNPVDIKTGVANAVIRGTTDDAFDRFRNHRNAAQYEGAVIQDQFKHLKTGDAAKDMSLVVAIQKGMAGKDIAAPVKAYFESALKRARGAGIDVGELPDYVPQIWTNTPEEIAQVFGNATKRAKMKPDFSYERVIADYETGIKKGLTPKYTNVADLAGWYETQLQTAMATREYFNYLRKTGNLIPSKGTVQQGWKTISPEILGGAGKGQYWQAPKDVVKRLEDLMIPNEGPIASVAKAVRKSKEMMLSGGVPGTAINAHGLVNIPNRVFDMTRSVPETLKTLGQAINVSKADKFLKANVKEIPRFVRAGMTAGAEGFWANVAETPTFKQLLADRKLGAAWDKVVSEPTFKKYLPAVQLQQAMKLEKKFIKSGMAPEEATVAAARTVNDFFSGKTFDDKSTKNLADIFLLAPAWQSTSWKIAKGAAAKGGAEGNVYKGAIGTMILKRLAADFTRQYLQDEEQPDSPGRSGNIPLYKDDRGLTAEADLMGASDRPVAMPYMFAANVARGLPIGNSIDSTIRGLASGPAGLAYSAIKNRDWRGRPMHSEPGKPVPTNETVGNYAGGVAGMFAPSPVRAGFDWARGVSSIPEASAQALELPMRWYGKRPAEVKSPFSGMFK